MVNYRVDYPSFKHLPARWKVKEDFSGIAVVTAVNASALLILGILIAGYYPGNSSVVSIKGAEGQSWQIYWGIGLIVTALATAVGSVLIHKNKKGSAPESNQNIHYGVGWLCAASPAGLIAVIVYLIRYKNTAALQAFILSAMYFMLDLLVYNPLNNVKTAMCLHPLLVSTSVFECNQESFVRMIADIEIRFFVVPLILVGFVRFVSICRRLTSGQRRADASTDGA